MEAPAAGGTTPAPSNGPSFGTKLVNTVRIRGQKFLDNSVPHKAARWIFLVLSLSGYLVRTYYLKGWYIVTYALGIYLLNILIAFLTPKVDPAMAAFDDDEEEEGAALPTKNSEEFKPFIRRLPEFKAWLSAQRAVIIAIVCTFFQAFNVPVFWPILVLYFFILFGISMKRQIRHMIRYKYIPFTTGKPKHKGKEGAGKVIQT
eukprot:m.136632 g.136632  ORF g.136632 m.136632 type:complete len:203 (-) comp17576_c0_seq1:148-756(-)